MNHARFRAYIEAEEGHSLLVYPDSRGVPTIGYGFNLSAPGARDKIQAFGLNPADVLAKKVGITEAQANTLIEGSLAEAEHGARHVFTMFDAVNDDRQIALSAMVYQMGLGGVNTFVHSVPLLNAQQWSEAGLHLAASDWHKQTAERSDRVIETLRSGVLQWPKGFHEPAPEIMPVPGSTRNIPRIFTDAAFPMFTDVQRAAVANALAVLFPDAWAAVEKAARG